MPQIKCERAWWRPASIISSAAVAIVLTTAPTVALAEEAGNQQADSTQVKQEQVVESVVSDATVPVAPVVVEAETVVENDVPTVEGDAPQSDAVETPEADTPVTDSEEVPADPSLDSTEVADDTTDDVLESEGDAEDPSTDVADDELVDDAETDATDDAATPEEDADLAEGETAADSTDEALVSEDGLGAAASEEDKEEETESVKAEQTIQDGEYVIGSGLDTTKVFDIPNGKVTDKSYVQLYDGNGTSAQKWEVKYHEEDGGYYTIGIAGTNKYLDVQWGNAFDGASVWLFEGNSTLSQRWTIKQEGSYWKILSQLGNYYLDVQWGNASNGTKIWLFSGNGNNPSQQFKFMQYNPDIPGNKYELEDGDGVYVIYVAEDTSGKNYALDVDDGSVKNAANVQIYQGNQSAAQRFYFERDAEGFYTITNIGSGKVLDLAGGSIIPTTNVQQYTSNNSDAQKWAIIKDDKLGCFYLVNKLSGLALDVQWGSFGNKANVWGYSFDRSGAQRWKLVKSSFVDDEKIYSIHSINDLNKVFDVQNGSSKEGAGIQIFSSNGTLSQRFEIVAVENTDDEYQIRTATSGGWLTVVGGKVVQSDGKDDSVSAENTWKAVWANGFFSLVSGWTDSSSKQYALTISPDGLMVVKELIASGDSSSQHFLFRPARLISDGYYQISSALGDKLSLDVSNGTFADGTNIQIFNSNGTNSQKFCITWNGSGYVITAARTDFVVGAEKDAATGKVNVLLCEAGDDSQIWDAKISAGGIVFVNRAFDMALDVQWGSATSGTKVWLYEENESVSQAWRLAQTTIPYGWTRDGNTWKYYDRNGSMLTDSIVAYNLYQSIKNESSRTDYLIAVDAEKCHVVLFKGSAGNWELVFDALAGTGDPHLASTDTDGYGVTGEGGNPWGSLRGYFWLGGDPASGYTDSNGRREYDGGSQLRWFRSIYGEYGFHSTCGNYSDPSQVGKRLSHGCIRLLEKYAKMIYDLPTYTRVIVLPRYNGDFQIIR